MRVKVSNEYEFEISVEYSYPVKDTELTKALEAILTVSVKPH